MADQGITIYDQASGRSFVFPPDATGDQINSAIIAATRQPVTGTNYNALDDYSGLSQTEGGRPLAANDAKAGPKASAPSDAFLSSALPAPLQAGLKGLSDLGGFGHEVEGLSGGATALAMGHPFSEGYDLARNHSIAQSGDFARTQTAPYIAGNIAGTLPVAEAGGGMLGKFGPLADWYSGLGMGGKAATAAGALGAVQGATSAPGGDFVSRLEGAAGDAALSSLLGFGVAKVVSPVVANLASGIFNAPRSLQNIIARGVAQGSPKFDENGTAQATGSVQLPDLGEWTEDMIGGANKRARQAASALGYQAQAALRPFGVDLTQGQATRNLQQQIFENRAMGDVYGPESEHLLGERMNPQGAQVFNAVTGIAANPKTPGMVIGSPSVQSPAQAGDALLAALRDRAGAAMQAEDDAWTAFRGNQGIIPSQLFGSISQGPNGTPQIVSPLINRVTNAARAAQANLDLPVAREIWPASSALQRLVQQTVGRYLGSDGSAPTPATMSEIDALHAAANGAVQSAANGRDKFVAGQMKSALDSWIDSTVNSVSQATGDSNLLAANTALKGARQATIDLHRRFLDNTVIKNLIQGQGQNSAPYSGFDAARALLSGSRDSVLATQKLVGEFGADHPVVQNLRDALLSDVPTNALESSARRGVVDVNAGGPWSGLTNRINTLLPGGQKNALAQALLSPAELANLKLLRDGVEQHLISLPAALQPSKSGLTNLSALVSWMRGMGPLALPIKADVPILKQLVNVGNTGAASAATTGFTSAAARGAPIAPLWQRPFIYPAWANPGATKFNAAAAPAMLAPPDNQR